MKGSKRLVLLFSLIVFIINVIAAFIPGIVVMIGYHNGVFSRIGPVLPLFLVCIISIVIGSLVASWVGGRVLAPIVQLRELTKKVSCGEYDVIMDESIGLRSLRELAHDFNVMVRELRQIEGIRSEFTASISHEFKTPLSAIEGYATLIQDPSLTRAERDEYANLIVKSTHRLSKLSSSILKLTRLENQNIIEKKPFKLDENIRLAILTLEKSWSEKNIFLNVSLDETVFYGDEAFMTQVWINLIENAVKYTKQSGTISVSLKNDSQNAAVIISDNGEGIPDEAIGHIFEKFFKADPSRFGEGVGLGLAIVKRIVTLAGGNISVKSKLGKGTTFTVTLPLNTK